MVGIYVWKSGERAEFPGGEMQKLRQVVESDDNWAVFVNAGVYLCSPLDERVVPYAAKMREAAPESDNTDEDYNEWHRRNSWRFGFIRCGESGKYRYVGVFIAEQIYYSGVSLEKYLAMSGLMQS
jgi:hypothetical protein